VNDPIEFRVDKDKLFLKRPNKGEFRLALMTRVRVLPSKDEGGAGKARSSRCRHLPRGKPFPSAISRSVFERNRLVSINYPDPRGSFILHLPAVVTQC
jgi:hypothetical protein